MYQQVAERQIHFAAVAQKIGCGKVGLAICAVQGIFLCFLIGFVRSGIRVLASGKARPKRIEVQRIAVGIRAGISDGTKRAVAQGQGLVKAFGR